MQTYLRPSLLEAVGVADINDWGATFTTTSTVEVNASGTHPALLLRQFSQLAVLVGGERVTAGLGAGWSTEEFAALGLELPPFRTRMDRLEEVLRLARGLYDHGAVTFEGTHIVARDLPLSPVPEQPPALLVGGGSDRVLLLQRGQAPPPQRDVVATRRPASSST